MLIVEFSPMNMACSSATNRMPAVPASGMITGRYGHTSCAMPWPTAKASTPVPTTVPAASR